MKPIRTTPLPSVANTLLDAERRGIPEGRAAARRLDSHLHAMSANMVSGLSPVSTGLALTDWGLNLASRPAEWAWLQWRAHEHLMMLCSEETARAAAGDGERSQSTDSLFDHAAWDRWPWSQWRGLHASTQRWWDEALDLRGMTPKHRDLTRFLARQWFDLVSPANAGLANPQVWEHTRTTLGGNLSDGWTYALNHWRLSHGLGSLEPGQHTYQPGVNLAITPGDVVYRNHLVELIQYRPTTATVHPHPVFIVPSGIMKYYVLDLSPGNSMVRWLVDQGHTVFILSWRNPNEADALLSLDDYLELGMFDALAAIGRLVPGKSVHTAGYCLGGTLLAIAAAALSRTGGIERGRHCAALSSVSLLAAHADFREPGEIAVLLDEAQVALIEDMMADRGFLTGPQMASSFAFLRSRDQVWSRTLREFWLGESPLPNDLAAWNSDLTRLPAVMHSQYLRRCFLNNDLAEGRYRVQGQPAMLSDLALPMFVVGTEKDHVSPWKSVYQIHRLARAEITFVVASGGHNAGIVSEPGRPGRHHRVLQRKPGDRGLSPEEWLSHASLADGSWWPAWHAWLMTLGPDRRVRARSANPHQVLYPAPGKYVHIRHQDPDF